MSVLLIAIFGFLILNKFFFQPDKVISAIENDECIIEHNHRYIYQSCSNSLKQELASINTKRSESDLEPLVINQDLSMIASHKSKHFALIDKDASTITSLDLEDAFDYSNSDIDTELVSETKEFAFNTQGLMSARETFDIMQDEDNAKISKPLYSSRYTEIGVGMYYNPKTKSNYWLIILS